MHVDALLSHILLRVPFLPAAGGQAGLTATFFCCPVKIEKVDVMEIDHHIIEKEQE